VITSKLIRNYIPEIKRIFFGGKIPSNVSVNLTDKCNQSCVYCEIGKNCLSQNSDLLTKDDLFWIITQMAEFRIKKLSMCGGEPFLFSGIIDVVEFAWKNNVFCNITSNGMTIHKLNDNEFHTLKKCKTIVNISVDSFNEEIQIQTRGNDSALKNALKSIQKLQENNIPVIILSVISKYNYHDLYKSLIHAHSLKITNVLYQPVIKYSNFPNISVIKNKQELNVSTDQFDILFRELQKIYLFERKHKINTNIYRLLPWIESYINIIPDKKNTFFFHKVLPKFYCREIFTVIEINYYGGIQPCGLIQAEKSIKDNKSIDLLTQWENATEKLKADLKSFNYPIYCNGCCHKFSRNMIASAFQYPFANRKILITIFISIFNRLLSIILKKLYIKEYESRSHYRC